ncbi:MAG TPA: hypothetical protein VKE51_06720 [Vicinamibacterales bacterium]|nr:hypothetical protein [Vicinamibacterales bacterium]
MIFFAGTHFLLKFNLRDRHSRSVTDFAARLPFQAGRPFFRHQPRATSGLGRHLAFFRSRGDDSSREARRSVQRTVSDCRTRSGH